MVYSGIYRKTVQVVNSLARMTVLRAWLAGWTCFFIPTLLLPHIPHTIYSQPISDKPEPGSLAEDEVSKTDQPLLLPDLLTLPPFDLRIVHLAGDKRLLRLSNTIWNNGEGSLELNGEISPSNNQIWVYQNIAVSDGSLLKNFVGEFVWHPSHEHWHFEDFTLYELWSLKPNGVLDSVIVSSDKLSYCVMDTDPVNRDNPAFIPRRNYFDCGQNLQGLSAGWGDTYKSHLVGQALDITNLPDGYYALISSVNPNAVVLEADYKNNRGIVYLEIRDNQLKEITFEEIRQGDCKKHCWS
jgi:hypothetical protein